MSVVHGARCSVEAAEQGEAARGGEEEPRREAVAWARRAMWRCTAHGRPLPAFVRHSDPVNEAGESVGLKLQIQTKGTDSTKSDLVIALSSTVSREQQAERWRACTVDRCTHSAKTH